MFVRHQGDGQTHNGKSFVVAAAVDGVDEPCLSIFRIVEIRNDQVEPLDESLANRIDGGGSAHEHKVVSTHMPDESVGTGQFADHGREDSAGDYQDFVAAGIAIPVVERFEVVDIQIGQGEGCPAFDARGRFMENRAVAGESGEGIGVQRAFKPAQAEAHPLRHFVGTVGHGDIVVHPERRPIQIVDPDITHQDDQGQPSQEGVGAQVPG